MRVIINDENAWKPKTFSSIIESDNNNEEDSTMLEHTDIHAVILYTILSDKQYSDIAAKKVSGYKLSEAPVFTEYKQPKTNQKGKVAVRVLVDISTILDTLNPSEVRKIETFKNTEYANKRIYSNDNELLSVYMLTKHKLIRYCQPQNTFTGTTYTLRYKIIDLNCIKQIEVIK